MRREKRFCHFSDTRQVEKSRFDYLDFGVGQRSKNMFDRVHTTAIFITMKQRYLTKSRFMVGLDCPTKLFYTRKEEYPDKSQEDPFLAALAEGGYQVGELARRYYEGGINIETLDYEKAEVMTIDLMRQDQVIIYEPAFRYKNLLIRIDILVKENTNLRLIEVKSKSFDSTEDQAILTKAGKIKSTWRPYCHDVAFQKYVLEKACPSYTISSYLMMADKSVVCQTDRLNQKFRIVKDDANRKGIKVSTSLSEEDLKTRILVEVPADEFVQLIHEDAYQVDEGESCYSDLIEFFAANYEQDRKIPPQIGSKCAKCQFRVTPEEEAAGMKSGFKECWMEALNWKDDDFQEPSILELWNSRKKDSYIASGKLRLKDLDQQDISTKSSSGPGLSNSERQWLQAEKVKNEDSTAYFDVVGMKAETDEWIFPLHHIDFETARVAIPFIKGRNPYEGIFFQFSHHIVLEDGTVEHAGQYINALPGEFPNYESVRELKKQLEQDNGTVFQYATHENTYLVEVWKQLQSDPNAPTDKDELCDFIASMTKHADGKGSRCMVDMCDLVKKYYYDPAAHGSNSIKSVLPAILNSSSFLQQKYSKPIYGSSGGISSLNYSDWSWVQFNRDGTVIEPYHLLPPVFEDGINLSEDLISEAEDIREGGAAMIAYCRMQFSEMSDYERERIVKALLKYCELDTLAMVMICEAWREWVEERC